MISKIKKASNDYLTDKIDKTHFTYIFKEAYHCFLDDSEKQFELEYIPLIPFIHNFAYCEHLSDLELKENAANFVCILERAKNYSYSSFFKLNQPKTKHPIIYEFHKKIIESKEIYFNFIKSLPFERKKIPVTISDVIENLICELITKIDFYNSNETDFDCVNCDDNIVFERAKERLFSLLEYYLGLKAFLFQIEIIPNHRNIYIVI